MRKDLPAAYSNNIVSAEIEESMAGNVNNAPSVHTKLGRGSIDTAAPFESVKAAVSMFGGIVDWKAHKAQTVERHNQVQVDLEKIQEEIEHYRSQSEAAEDEKARVLHELEGTRRLIEELKLGLEKAEIEEAQAKQDSELALLRVTEIRQGIAGDASVAAQAELDVAKARHVSAVTELKSVREELESTRQEHTRLLEERDATVRNAAQAAEAARDIEKKLEDVSLDVLAAKETLESAHAAHMEAEEHRINVELAQRKDAPDWEEQLRQAEEETRKLEQKISGMKELQAKVEAASAVLLDLKGELAACVDAQKPEDSVTRDALLDDKDRELEEVKLGIEKAKEDVQRLRVAAASLKEELAGEEAAVRLLREKQGEICSAEKISSLECELVRMEMEIGLLQAKETETRAQLEQLPHSLQQATMEAEAAKEEAASANEELLKAREEAEQARAHAAAAESKLRAAMRETDAAKASERLALDAIKALEESEQAASSELESGPHSGVTLPLVEYYALSKRAHDAEEDANEKVVDALSQVEEARKAEARCLEKLAELTGRLEERKETLRAAAERADGASDGKLAVEQELREWRAVNEQRRKASDEIKDDVFNPCAGEDSPRRNPDGRRETKSMDMGQESPSTIRRAHSAKIEGSDEKAAEVPSGDAKKKKKSFFPRIVMFLARKKAHSAAAKQS